jgi:hypothetical protein
MSWHELARLGVTVRPITGTPPPGARRYSPFRASLITTVETLARELRQLDARRIVLEIDLRERDIRVDGLPRADARPNSPGVVLAFESKFGPLKYATGEYHDWKDNLRAIALSMESLRAVDRYGVSKRGEQYQGWRALPTSTDPADAITTRDQAWAVIAEAAGIPIDSSPLLNGISETDAIRRAIRNTHPDTGGDADEFRKVIRARGLLA